MSFRKTFIALCISCLAITGNANDKPVVFKSYSNYEKDILRTLRESGGVSSFTSMSALKHLAEGLAENTPVKARLLKENTKKMDGVKIASQRSESVLMICKYMPKVMLEESVQIGATGIVISEDGVCISNYHVFQPLIDAKSKLMPLDSIYFVATGSGKTYSITSVLSYNKAADIAVFRIDTKGKKIPAIPIGHDLPQGAPINALTHPVNHPFYFSKGVVARNVSVQENDPFANRTEITADYAKGSSGGPLMDDCGNLVGMVTTTQSIYYRDNPQTDIQMVVKSIVPISSILRVIKNL